MTALRETRNGDDDGEGSRTLRPVNYLPLARFVESQAPIHISNSISVHQQGVYIGMHVLFVVRVCVRVCVCDACLYTRISISISMYTPTE